MDFTFANFLEEFELIDNAGDVDATILKLYLDDYYEPYVTYCRDKNIEHENLDYEFFALTNRKKLEEIRIYI